MSKLPTQAWNKEKMSPHIPQKRLFPSAKITLQMTHSDWLNLATHTACERSLQALLSSASRSCVLARLTSLAQIGELARRLVGRIFFPLFSSKLFITFVLHEIFFFRQALAGNFFSKLPHLPPPPPQELNGRPLT